MILGIGVDIVHVDRMAHWLEKPELMQRFFHSSEIDDARRRGKTAALSLAARFAAKEAFGKALGTGLHGMILKEIRVRNNRHGKPEIELFGMAKKALHDMGGKKIHLTMTHERDNAVAMVVLEGEGQ